MALTYQPNTGQNLGQTRDNIRNNWEVIDATIRQDHIETNFPNQGMHTAVHFVNQATNPSAPKTQVGQCCIYAAPSILAPGTSALYFKAQSLDETINGNEFTTSSTSNPAQAYTTLPTGVIMQWGLIDATSAGNPITFAIPFPHQCQSVQVTNSGPPANINFSAANATTTGFNAYSSTGGPNLCYYFAIGW